jgi:ribonucleoside-diphosphate reductase alpha chain
MIEIKAQIELHDGITTETIDELLLKAMVDLIDEVENPSINNVNYQYVAGRQKVSMLRKQVYGTYTPPKLYEIVKRNVELGMYTSELLEWYTEDEWNIIDLFLDHDKDETYTYAAIAQLAEKYLVQNRATGTIYESPQVRYAIAAATAFHNEPKETRLKYVKEYYECASEGHFTLATPVLAGLGTTTKQFSSCVLISSDDTLDSIFAAGEMMAKYASKRAGIGLEIGRIRPLGAPIRNGEIKHTGMIPFLKKWFADLRSCSQGGIRNASCTVTFPIWHAQFEDLIVLKNNQGTEETRVRQMDYSVVINKMFWNRYRRGENITLFDPHQVPDLYEAYYRDSQEFEKLYLQYEKDSSIKKKVLSAEEMFKNGILKERTDTGRIYLVNIDNVINQGPFDTTVDPIYQSNLCLTGDTVIQIMNTDSNVQSMSLASFVEQYEFGAMTGVKVRSSDISTGEVTWNTVSNAAKTATVTELIEIEDESGKIIRCTPDHQIYTKNRGYVKAGDLLETDVLCVES